jgi:tetratricopeptide (TPR) repeat protein
VNKVGDNYLINVELIRASDRSHLWGKQYNRKATDLLIVQSEISREIGDELRLHLTKAGEDELARSQALNPQAYDLYLKGLALSNTGKSANRKKAIEYFEQATVVDPKYALAYVELSRAYSWLITDNELPQKEFMPKADAAAQKALAADPNLAQAHLVVSLSHRNRWEWAAAETELKRALELNPNLAEAHNAFATFLIIHGRINEAVTEINRVQQLDPLRTSVAEARVDILALYGQNDQALEGAKEILRANPNLPGAHFRVGQFYLRVGRNAEAVDEFLEAIRLGDESGDAQLFLADAYARAGQRDKALAILKRFETGELYSSPFGVAVVQLALADKERMYAELEKAYAMRDQQLTWLRAAWEFEPVRSEPRFQSLVQRIGL